MNIINMLFFFSDGRFFKRCFLWRLTTLHQIRSLPSKKEVYIQKVVVDLEDLVFNGGTIDSPQPKGLTTLWAQQTGIRLCTHLY